MPGRELRTYLWLIAGREAEDGWIEIRYRVGAGMRSEFHRADRREALERRIRSLGRGTDVYVGAAIRSRQAGTKDAVARAWLAWADCDSAESVARLKDFKLPPSLVIASGTPGHAHAYWTLREPATAAAVEDLNRRLAAALGADQACTDAGRILRPPETWNHKREAAVPVRLVGPLRAEAYKAARIGRLPAPLTRPPATRTAPRRSSGDDPLASISAVEYVPRLSGHDVDRGGKVACPFHDDRTPSLHAYDDPERGWYCFGCGKGGSIYDFAAELRGVEPRGAAFLALRDELMREFGIPTERERRPRSGLSRFG